MATEVSPLLQAAKATYSPEDNKLRLYSAFRLDADTYKRVRDAGFIYAPKQELFVAPAWTPSREDLLVELAGEIGDEDTSLVDRAEQRAERFEEYKENRTADAEAAHKEVERITSGIPMGQPILVGHHSERHARKDAERIENGMRKAVKMWRTAEYWKDRAAGAIRHAKYKELPTVRARRIKTLNADKRKHERTKSDLDRLLNFWSQENIALEDALKIANYLDRGSVRLANGDSYHSAWGALEDRKITVEEVKAQRLASLPRVIAHYSRWIEHLDNRLAYEKAMLGSAGGLAHERFKIEVGGKVLARGEWVTVLRINRKNGALLSLRTTARYVPIVSIEQVQDYREPEAGTTEKVQDALKKGPMVNHPGEGYAEMTKAQWDRIYRDYKGTRNVVAKEGEYGKHRYRTVVKGGQLLPVFITDAKVIKLPPYKPDTKISFNNEPELAHRIRVKREASETEQKIEALNEQLKAGVKVVVAEGLYATPKALAARMVAMADVHPGDEVLEPNAGTGRIVDALDAVPGAKVTAIEISNTLSDNLRLRVKTSTAIRCADFLECNNLGKFDRIIMNPPFEKAQDIKHIKHALTFLKPGGLLVALCANGPRQNEQLKPMAAIWEDLPAGSFEEAGTGVNVALLRIHK